MRRTAGRCRSFSMDGMRRGWDGIEDGARPAPGRDPGRLAGAGAFSIPSAFTPAMSDSRIPDGYAPGEPPAHRPGDSYWPYADVPEEPTPEELAALDPELHDALFGRTERPFSITLSFRPFDGPDGERALAPARSSTISWAPSWV